jgi:hypothetical protein
MLSLTPYGWYRLEDVDAYMEACRLCVNIWQATSQTSYLGVGPLGSIGLSKVHVSFFFAQRPQGCTPSHYTASGLEVILLVHVEHTLTFLT